MEYVSAFMLFSVFMGLIVRLSTGRKRGRCGGLATPARFVDLTGHRVSITTRSD